jgi:hypothetical protein
MSVTGPCIRTQRSLRVFMLVPYPTITVRGLRTRPWARYPGQVTSSHAGNIDKRVSST